MPPGSTVSVEPLGIVPPLRDSVPWIPIRRLLKKLAVLSILGFGFPLLLSADSLSYTVSLLGLPVVDVTITATDSDSSRQVTYHARTRRWFDGIYQVDNRYTIWVNPVSGLPHDYHKQVVEKGAASELRARYEGNPRRVVYSNGQERPWEEGSHTLFSALVWAQEHDWQAGEEQIVRTEIEGVIWDIHVVCTGLEAATEDKDPLAGLTARFLRRVGGQPVLENTDILTSLLPGEGNKLKFALDLVHNQVQWIEFRSWPIEVRAELNRKP